MSEHGPSSPKGEVKLTLEQGGNEDEQLQNAELSPEGKKELQEILDGKGGTDLLETVARLGQMRLLRAMFNSQESSNNLEEAQKDAQTNSDSAESSADSIEFLTRLHEKHRVAQQQEIEDLRHRLAS